MLKVNCEIKGLKELEKKIEYVKQLSQMKTDKSFQKFIQDKAMEALNYVMNERLGTWFTTNDDSIDLYKNSNHIKELDDGFIIYNDAKIPAEVSGVQNDVSNYSNGEFSIAMAFEYGVGIIGMSTGNPNAWEYNVNGYNFGWVLPNSVAEMYGMPKGKEFAGYQGFEIYRYTIERVKKDLPNWVNEYFSGGGSK